jgi:uncharacterized Ntn-hydrolase superfamily protein
MTFSLVARCASTGMFGVAVASSSPAVAARCAHAEAGIGAVASQNVTDPALGPRALALMRSGATAAEAVAILRRTAPHAEYRQILAVDRDGGSAVHSGSRALGIWAEATGPDVASGGNLLAHDDVPAAIVAAFGASEGHLGDRLLVALRAGLDAGGEAGPIRSAGIKVMDRLDWPIVDLRCDWTEDCPIAALETVWEVYRPQIAAYVTRALDPTAAPAFGVPGDEEADAAR